MNWCFETLKHGTRPTKRHDDKPWEPKDDLRKSKAGAKSIKGVLIDLKSDWAEYGGTMGLPIWNDNRRPCFGCNCNPRTMNVTTGIHATNPIWRPNCEEDYFNDCENCEIEVKVTTNAMKSTILQYLFTTNAEADMLEEH